MDHEHVRVAVADAERPGFEEVPAKRLNETEWELLRSPLYAMEVAAGDQIKITNWQTGQFEVVRHGGNVCVQFYLSSDSADDPRETAEISDELALALHPIGGRMDCRTPGLAVFTIPFSAGFPAIETAFEAAVRKHAGSQWQYTNVYDSTSGEPLDWWQQISSR